MYKFRHYIAILSLFIVICGTFFAWKYSVTVIQNDSKSKFDATVQEAGNLIETRINQYTESLYGTRGLFAALAVPTRLQWNRYIKSVDVINRNPGILIFSFARRVPVEEKDAYVASVRNDTSVDPAGYPDFKIFPEVEKNDYYVTTYIEPLAGWEKALGFDLSSEQNRLDGLIRAWKSGDAAASAPFMGVANHKLGFSIYLPVYKYGKKTTNSSDLTGYVVAGFPLESFFDSLFDKRSSYKGIDIAISDSTSKGDAHIFMYDSKLFSFTAEKNILSKELPIDVVGRVWTISAHAPQGYGLSLLERAIPYIILITGLLSTLLLLFLFYGAHIIKKAFLFGRKNTRSMEDGMGRYSDLFNSVSDIYYKTDVKGIILEVSPAVKKYTGIDAKDAIGLNATDFYPNPKERDDLLKQIKVEGSVSDYSLTLVGKGGKNIPASLSAHLIFDEKGNPAGVEGILRDISERSKMEEELREKEEDLARLNHILEKKESSSHRGI